MLSVLPSWNRNIERNNVLGEWLSSFRWKGGLLPSVSLSPIAQGGNGSSTFVKSVR